MKIPSLAIWPVLLACAIWVGGCRQEAAPSPATLAERQNCEAAARQQLDAALASSNPVLRTHAVEALANSVGAGASRQILQAMDDPNPMVRFAAAMAAGDLALAEARDVLLRLTNDHNPHPRLAAVFALHRLGDTRFSRNLEQALKDTEPQVRANACFALGRLNEKSAVRILRPMLRDNSRAVRLQAAEALWRLGDQQGLEWLVVANQSPDTGDQMLALRAMAEPRDPRLRAQIWPSLSSKDLCVALVAARALGMLDSADGYKLAVGGARSKEASDRFLAALALGSIRKPEAQPVLAPMLNDPDARVRIAAAMAILQLHAADEPRG